MLEGTLLGLFYVLIGIISIFILIGIGALLFFLIKKGAIDRQTELNSSNYSKI
jgi:hypothetical protein